MDESPSGMRVVRHDSDVGRWEMVIREPDPRLRAYIQSYEGYSESTRGFMRRLEPASTRVVLIIGLGSGLVVIDPRDQGRDDAAADHTSFVAGLYDSYVHTETRGTGQCGIQVNFTPLGAYQFLHLPMHLLSNRVIELDDLLGPVACRLVERLHETPSWEARFALLDAFIFARLAEGRAPTCWCCLGLAQAA